MALIDSIKNVQKRLFCVWILGNYIELSGIDRTISGSFGKARKIDDSKAL